MNVYGPGFEVALVATITDAQLKLLGQYDSAQTSSPRTTSLTSPPSTVHYSLLGISYDDFGGPRFGYRTATGVAAFSWLLAISLWWFVGLFSILPLIWLIRQLRRKSKDESADSPPPANTFTLKNIFVAVTLVAIAGGMQALLQTHSYRLGYTLLLWYGSGALVGAAIFGMIRRPIVGAFIGLLFQGILIVLMKAFFRISF